MTFVNAAAVMDEFKLQKRTVRRTVKSLKAFTRVSLTLVFMFNFG